MQPHDDDTLHALKAPRHDTPRRCRRWCVISWALSCTCSQLPAWSLEYQPPTRSLGWTKAPGIRGSRRPLYRSGHSSSFNCARAPALSPSPLWQNGHYKSAPRTCANTCMTSRQKTRASHSKHFLQRPKPLPHTRTPPASRPKPSPKSTTNPLQRQCHVLHPATACVPPRSLCRGRRAGGRRLPVPGRRRSASPAGRTHPPWRTGGRPAGCVSPEGRTAVGICGREAAKKAQKTKDKRHRRGGRRKMTMVHN